MMSPIFPTGKVHSCSSCVRRGKHCVGVQWSVRLQPITGRDYMKGASWMPWSCPSLIWMLLPQGPWWGLSIQSTAEHFWEPELWADGIALPVFFQTNILSQVLPESKSKPLRPGWHTVLLSNTSLLINVQLALCTVETSWVGGHVHFFAST